MRSLLVALVLAGCTSRSTADAWSPGRATFYSANSNGHCGLGPKDWRYTAALPTWAYAAAKTCGAFVEISSVGAVPVSGDDGCSDNTTIIAMVTDECPEADNAQWCSRAPDGPMHFDLSKAAFDELFVPACGAVQGFTWRWVERPDDTNLSIVSKDGVNRWWFAFFVKAHRYALVSAEVRDGSPNATWQPAQRQPYNAWLIQSGNGLTAPLSIRLTDVHGQQVTLENVVTSFAAETTFATTTQFPAGRGGGNPLAP